MPAPFILHASVPPGLCVAFYKGTRPGIAGGYNRLGRALDHGPYSHTEVVTTDGVSLSSSFMDGGVRGKLIGYSSVGDWDFLPIPDPDGEVERRVWCHFNATQGRGYDVTGNIRFALGIVSETKDKDFCSEWAMAAFGYREAWRYGPCGAATQLQHDFKTTLIEVNR